LKLGKCRKKESPMLRHATCAFTLSLTACWTRSAIRSRNTNGSSARSTSTTPIGARTATVMRADRFMETSGSRNADGELISQIYARGRPWQAAYWHSVDAHGQVTVE